MKYYNLIDKKILKENKIDFIGLGIVSVVLFIIGFIALLTIENGIYVLGVFCIMDIVILLPYYFAYRKYLVKVKLNDSIIDVYINGKYKRQFDLKSFNVIKKEVAITFKSRYRNQIISSCLIVYRDIELYDLMEYPSYWNEDNILIIQNKELIDEILKVNKIIL